MAAAKLATPDGSPEPTYTPKGMVCDVRGAAACAGVGLGLALGLGFSAGATVTAGWAATGALGSVVASGTVVGGAVVVVGRRVVDGVGAEVTVVPAGLKAMVWASIGLGAVDRSTAKVASVATPSMAITTSFGSAAKRPSPLGRMRLPVVK